MNTLTPGRFFPSKSKAAFTLVELLVVIAIILFLVGLLMPALQRVKETAKMAKCMSNMRQISMATFLYAADNEGVVPWDGKTVGKGEYFVSRSHEVGTPSYQDYYPKNKWFAEYLPGGGPGKMNPIGYCPKGGRVGDIGPNVPKAPYFNFSYGMNPDLFEDWWITNANNDRCSIPLSMVKLPAKTCLWIESNQGKTYVKRWATTGRHFSNSRSPAIEPGPTVGSYSIYQYEGKMNVVFVDQHIGTIRVPDEIPIWSCVFWMHYNGPKCPANLNPPCNWCNKNQPQ